MPPKPPAPPLSTPMQGQFITTIGVTSETLKQLLAIRGSCPYASIADTVARIVAREFDAIFVDATQRSD